MITARPFVISITLVFSLSGCVEPKDRRPGLWLSGEVSDFPSDWSFTDSHHEIAVEVATPYFIAHSVTIWCVALDNDLYIGARNPDEKNWPGWVESDPNVGLQVADRIFEGKLAIVEDERQIENIRAAYRSKYSLPAPPPKGGPRMRYWRVERRN